MKHSLQYECELTVALTCFWQILGLLVTYFLLVVQFGIPLQSSESRVRY